MQHFHKTFLVAGFTCLVLVGASLAQGAVVVDAAGVLATAEVKEDWTQLEQRRKEARNPWLPADLATPSPCRKVSLVRLARWLTTLPRIGAPLPESMRALAGLQRIDSVFLYPATADLPADIVIAGPAEGWVKSATGRFVGRKSGRTTLHLDDFVVALRAFPPDGEPQVIGCGISPTEEGLGRLRRYLANHRAVGNEKAVQTVVRGMREALGQQPVSIFGVPANSRLGLTLVEADYRMKLIAIELEPRPVPALKTYLDHAIDADFSSLELLNMWTLLPSYKKLRTTPERNAFQLVGARVRIESGTALISTSGELKATASEDVAGKLFAADFTRLYPEIAATSQTFSDLANAVDLLVLAALLQREKSTAGLERLYDPVACPVAELTVPTSVQSVVNYRWKSQRRVLTPVGGGVTIAPHPLLRELPVEVDEQLAHARDEARSDRPSKWWWD